MTIPPPDPAAVRNLAFLISSMPLDRAAGVFRRVIVDLRAGALAKGWPARDAEEYALAFGDQIIAAINAMPPPTRMH